MALSVIGSGFGRTGTTSLKEALEQPGFAPCHHMHEIVTHPEQVAHWQEIAAGQPVDWPSAHVWRELSAAFPEAELIHTLRPAAQVARGGRSCKGVPAPQSPR